MSSTTLHYTVHTDGACRGNPGPGGYGYIVEAHDDQGSVVLTEEGCEGHNDTTNNRMELCAAITALEGLPDGSTVTVVSDSKYLIDGMSRWLEGWRMRGWLTSSKKPVLNLDLWLRLDEAAQRLVPKWQWVRGHAGNPLNERADALANQGMATYL